MCRYQNQNFSLMSLLRYSSRTRFALVHSVSLGSLASYTERMKMFSKYIYNIKQVNKHTNKRFINNNFTLRCLTWMDRWKSQDKSRGKSRKENEKGDSKMKLSRMDSKSHSIEWECPILLITIFYLFEDRVACIHSSI